jgi:hypothetical protein
LLVDLLGARFAHAIEPGDIERFSRDIKSTLNPTSRAIVLRSVQRCFNWGVERRLIPPHKLGRIRKPLRRDRFLSDQEFQSLLQLIPVPEPASLAMLFIDMIALGRYRFSRSSQIRRRPS